MQAANTTLDPKYYGDLPTALLHILEDLDNYLQARPWLPAIYDPAANAVSIYHPLVVDRRDAPAVPPVPVTLPANAVVGVRYDATGSGAITEVLCYGTAVVVEAAV